MREKMMRGGGSGGWGGTLLLICVVLETRVGWRGMLMCGGVGGGRRRSSWMTLGWGFM
jgi:hypothetical protein